jgi:dihydroorotase
MPRPAADLSPPPSLTFIAPDDWHVHLRDDVALATTVPATARQFRRAIVMPNLKPPVRTVTQAQAYYARILAAVPEGASFEPLMTLYLTNNTPADEIAQVAQSGFVKALKFYPAGATTNSDAGVTDIMQPIKALEAMQKLGVPLLVHGEVTDPQVDVFDREARFIDDVMRPLRHALPELKVVFEHITTSHAAQYVESADAHVAATITPQHLLYNRNAIFNGGIRPHLYCLPIWKRESHRLALVKAATGGSRKFFLGTDSAPHARDTKENACGCAGCYSAPYALELYAQAFESVNALDKLEAFASLNGPDFYSLPRNTHQVTLQRRSQILPARLPYVDDSGIVPLKGGETLEWTFAS